jgi:hypothetical protein
VGAYEPASEGATRLSGWRAAGVAAASLLLFAFCSCSPLRNSAGGAQDGPLDFALTNFTGVALRGVYLSPQDSTGWEENLLGGGELTYGDTVDIRFSPEERAALWDLRVESAGGAHAEWKGLDLRAVNRITLRLKEDGERVAVAELE